MEEIFRPIPFAEGYHASNLGRIKSTRRKNHIIMKTQINICGYECVDIKFNDGYKNTPFVHRMVMMAFVQRNLEGLTVNHKDGNKLNNNLSNLEVTTYSENGLHAFRLGLKVPQHGENNPMSKISNEQAINLIEDLRNGLSNTEIGLKYSLHSRYVSLIRHKRRWKNIWSQVETCNDYRNHN